MNGLNAPATRNVLYALQQLTGQAGAKERAISGAVQQALGGLNRGMARRDAYDHQELLQQRARTYGALPDDSRTTGLVEHAWPA